jgi:hypothetical protein
MNDERVTREKEMDMMKRALFISISVLLLVLPFTAWAANLPAKVYENGTDSNPTAVADVKVEVFGGYAFKALFSSAKTGANGGCILRNVPLGKEVLVKLTKAGYVTQYDIRSYSEADAENDVVLWIGTEGHLSGMYSSLGEPFNAGRGHVYLDISNELDGEGIEGVQFAVSSGKVFDLGGGEYLIANAEESSLKVDIQKPGYAFDVESATIPLFPGAMTQYYITVQSGGGVYESASLAATSASITGTILSLSGAPVSCASIAFTNSKGQTMAWAVHTDQQGHYSQTGFLLKKNVRVTPTKAGYRFRPTRRTLYVRDRPTGNVANFTGIPLP